MSEDADFLNDSASAQKAMQSLSELKEWVAIWQTAKTIIDDVEALIYLAEEDKDESLESEIIAELAKAEAALSELEIRNLLSDKDDSRNALLTIHSGAGGTEAQDWAEMLLRMYSRWCERHNYKIYLVDELEGDGAGIKSATIEIEGKFAYGYLK